MPSELAAELTPSSSDSEVSVAGPVKTNKKNYKRRLSHEQRREKTAWIKQFSSLQQISSVKRPSLVTQRKLTADEQRF
jgi:hypothetical protein